MNELQEQNFNDELNSEMKKEIINILENKKKSWGKEEYESYLDKAFAFAEIGEEVGFVRGFKYAFRLCLESMHD